MKLKYLAIGLLLAGGLMATDSPTLVKLQPNEVQTLRLQVKQKDAQLAQRDMQDATVKFQQSLAALQEEGNKVKTENKWEQEVAFNPNTLEFTKTVPVSKPAEAKKP